MNFDPNEERLMILSADFKLVLILKKCLQVSIICISKQSKITIFSVLYVDMRISDSPRSLFIAFQIVLDVSVSLSKKKHSFYGLGFSSCSFIMQTYVWNEAVQACH